MGNLIKKIIRKMKLKFLISMIATVYAAADGEKCTADKDCTEATGKIACCGYVSKKDTADARACFGDTLETATYGTATGTTTGWVAKTMRFGCKPYGVMSGTNLKVGVLS